MAAPAHTMTSRKPRRGPRRGDPLTQREVQILALVAAGEPTPAISRRLGITENTIKTHLTSVYKKTGSRNRVQAARYYLHTYTRSRTSDPAEPGEVSVVQQRMREIQARLDELAPATIEAERLRHALDALRAIEPI